MSANHELVQSNSAAREQLRTLVLGLTDSDLAHPMPARWTVSAVLAHLAFWDLRALTLLEKWQAEGIGPAPIDGDVLNEAMRPLCLAIPPRKAVELALSTAVAIDQTIERLAPEFAAMVEREAKTLHLNRAPHRREHVREIEQAVG